MIQNAPGRAHHHKRTVLQALLLAAQSHTAAQRDHFDIGRGARQPAYFGGDLIGEFAGRAQHQRLNRMKVGSELLHQRQTKCSRLAAAGAGLRNHILSSQSQRQTGRLNRCHLGVAELVQIVEGVGGKSERAKGGSHAGIIGV